MVKRITFVLVIASIVVMASLVHYKAFDVYFDQLAIKSPNGYFVRAN